MSYNNKTKTLNNDVCFKSTLNHNLDLFGSDLRINKNNLGKVESIEKLLINAFNEDKKLAIANMFNIIDVRNGKGEKFMANIVVKFLASVCPNFLKDNLKYFINLTRWDRVFKNFSFFNNEIKKEIIKLINDNKDNGLMFKWLPSINTSSFNTVQCAKQLANYLKMSEKKYRKFVSQGRKTLNLIETNLTNKTYNNINIKDIPKLAYKKYNNALWKYKEQDMEDYTSKLNSGEIKVNVDVLSPVEIYEIYMKKYDAASANGLWKNQKDLIKGQLFPVIDVSGSMIGKPSAVANSLGIYLAERNKGNFHNKIMLFSEDSRLINIAKAGGIFTEAINIVLKNSDVANTNLDSVYEKFIELAKEEKMSIPNKIILISDGQFDAMVDNGKAAFERWKEKFNELNIKQPLVIYWNVNAPLGKFPFKAKDNIVLVSGYSINIIKELDEINELNDIDNINIKLMNKALEKYITNKDINWNNL